MQSKMLALGRRAITLLVMLALSGSALADESTDVSPTRRGPPTGLGFSLVSAFIHQFESGLNGGGSFDAARFVARAGARYAFEGGSFVALSLSYGFDDYDFSQSASVGGRRPWDRIQNIGLSAPIFIEYGEKWLLLLIPNLRMAAERPEDFGDGLSGGFISGFSYEFSEGFSVGPGIGVTSEIGDSASVFPVILVDWKIGEHWRIDTGRALGATRGPGLVLSYQPTTLWQFQLGFRYEKARFRLGPDAGSPSGIGEDRSFPVLGGVRFGLPFAYVALIGGAEFAGRLRIEDHRGQRIGESTFGPAGTIGINARFLF
jgi:hypothetical protein